MNEELVLSSEIISSPIVSKMVDKRCYFTSRQQAKHLSNEFEDESEDEDSSGSPHRVRSPGGRPKSIMKFLHQRGPNQTVLNQANSSKKLGFSDIWRRGALRIIYLISKFLQMLKTSTDQYKFKLLNSKIFSILGDKASDFQFYSLNGHLKDRPGTVQKLMMIVFGFIKANFGFKMYNLSLPYQNSGIIKPDNLFKIYFDVLVLILIVMNLLYIPLRLSFELQEMESQGVDFMLVTLPSIVERVYFLKSRTDFHLRDPDQLQHRLLRGGSAPGRTQRYHQALPLRRVHLGHHCRHPVTYTIFPTKFNSFLISRFSIPYIDFVLLLRVKSVKRIIEHVEEATSIREKFAGALDLFKLVSFLIFTNHICACIWHYLGQKQVANQAFYQGVVKIEWHSSDVWLVRYNMVHQNWTSRYIYCFYWSTITTLTVGYGDIVPGNDLERVVSIVIVLICSIVFGYTLTRIGFIFTQMKEKNDRFKNSMAMVSSYLKQHKLNKPLQMKVKKYFEYYFKSQEVPQSLFFYYFPQESANESQQLLEKLSSDLKREVGRDIFKKILQRSKIITETFSQRFTDELCGRMKLKHFLPGDVIFTQDQVLSQLLFLIKGEMQAFVERDLDLKTTTRIHLRTYQKGYVIGTKNFFQNKSMEFSSKASKFVEIAYLQYEVSIHSFLFLPKDFIKVLRDFPEDQEKFALLRDNLLFNRKFNKVVDVCTVCSSNHQLRKCPFVFYQVNRYKLIFEKQPLLNQRIHKRRSEIQNGVIEFCIENEMLEEDDLTSDYEKKLGLFESKIDPVKENSSVESDHSNEKVYLTPKIANSKKDITQARVRRRSVSTKKNTHVSFKQEEIDQNDMLQKRKYSQDDEKTLLILDIVRQDYKYFIREDRLPELDRYSNFGVYYPSYNCSAVLLVLKEIIDENCVLLLKGLQKKKFKKNNNLKIKLAKRASKIPKGTFQGTSVQAFGA